MDDRINDIIIRTLIGDSCIQEQAELQRWATSSDANSAYLRKQYEIWFSAATHDELQRFDKDRAATLFFQRIEQSRRKHKRMRSFLYRIAAVILFLVVSLTAVFFYIEKDSRVIYNDILVSAPDGSRSTVTLPDGSTVWINSRSHVRYRQDFGITDRHIIMDGECYFDVAKLKDKTFSVVTNGTEIHVKGTKFNVRDYKDDTQTVVVLEEGLVSLTSAHNDAPEVLLKPGHRALIDKKTGTIHIEECDADGAKQWTYDAIKIDGLTIEQIAQTLSVAYNVQIVVKLKHKQNLYFSGTFLRQTDTIDDVLDVLSATGKISYLKSGKTYIIQ